MAMLSGRFNLLASKRAGDQTGGRFAKLPRAGDISVEQGPRPAQAPRRLPAVAPVEVCMYKYTDQAADLWDLFQGKDDVPLFQVQVTHQAQRSIVFSIRDSFNDFLRAAHAANEAMPASVQQLEAAAGIRLVVTDRADPDDVGYQQWRVAFYAVDLPNFLLILDGFFRFKERQVARDQPFQVMLRPHTGIDVSGVWDDLDYEHYTLQEASDVLPLHVFDAQPVVGKRIAVMNLQIETDAILNIILTGHTWPWRGRLDAFGVAGGYYADDKEDGARRYFRVWKQIDVSDEAQQEKVFDMCGSAVFKNVVMRVSLDRYPQADTHVAAFVERLRQRPALFFTPTPEDEDAETQQG